MRRLLFLILLTGITAGGAWAAFRPSADGGAGALRDAVGRLSAGDAEGALASAELAFRTAHTSGEAAALASLARAATENLPAAFGRLEAAARRDPADAEAALGAGLLARFLARRLDAPESERRRLSERSRAWLRDAARRADAGVAAAPDSFGRRAVAVAARIAAGDVDGAHAGIAAMVPRSPAEEEERVLVRAAAFVSRGEFDAALAALGDDTAEGASARLAAAAARVRAWRDAAAESPRDAGLRAWRGGDAARAAESLAAWTDEHPDDPVALAALAAASARLGAGTEAARRQSRLEEAQPGGPAAPYFRGCLLLASGRAEEAESAFLVAGRRAPASVAVLRGVVQARLDGGDAARAVEAVRAWQREHGAHAPSAAASLLLGVALDAAGDVRGAEAALREAWETEPRDAEAPDRLAELLVATGRPGDAVAVVRRALGSAPSSVPLRLRLGLALLASGDRGGAESALRELTEAAPSCAAAYVHLGRCLFLRGAVPEAAAAFEAALRGDPDRIEAHLGLLAVAQGLGRLDDFRERARRACEERPQSSTAWFVAGAAADGAGDLDAAEVCHRHALALDSRCGPAANNLAWLLAVGRGNLREALALADRAVRSLPRSPQPLDTRGWVRFLGRDFESAERDLARARAGLPRDPDVAVRHARALLALGRADDAASALHAALAAAPSIRQDPAFRAAARQAQVRFE